MIKKIFSKLLNTNESKLSSIRPVVEKINELETEFSKKLTKNCFR